MRATILLIIGIIVIVPIGAVVYKELIKYLRNK